MKKIYGLGYFVCMMTIDNYFEKLHYTIILTITDKPH